MKPRKVLEIVRDTLRHFVGPDQRYTEAKAEQHFDICVLQLENDGQTTFTVHGPKTKTDKVWAKVVVELWLDQSKTTVRMLKVTQLALLDYEEVELLQKYLLKLFSRCVQL